MKTTLLALLLSAGIAGARPSFTTLGFLQDSPSIAFGVSPDGRTVVGVTNSPEGFQAFVWTKEAGMVGLGSFDDPGGKMSQAMGVSVDGATIVGSSVRPDSLNEDGSPCRWIDGEGPVYLGNLGGSSSGGTAFGVTPDGAVIVGYSHSKEGDYKAFRWTEATGPIALASLPNQKLGKALAVSADGSVIVGYCGINDPANPKAARWANGGVEKLPSLNDAAISGALGITPDGSIITGISAGRAVRWINGGVQNLGLIPGGSPQTNYYGEGISADGSVVVGLGDLNQGQGTGTAIIWDAQHGMRDLNKVLVQDYGLNLNGFQLFDARAITPDGKTIVGYGFGLLGQEAFIVDLHSACEADCDGSGTLDIDDFICFQTLFGLGDPAADCDSSGSLDIDDFVCFQTEFGIGCQ